MIDKPDPHHTSEGPSNLPRRLRWLHPLLALAGLSSLPTALPARSLDTATPIQQVPALRARLLAADARATATTSPATPPAAAAAPPDDQVAQWKKWNDWNNWAKWGKQ